MRPGRTDYLLLALLGATWGGSFLLIKLAVATVPPLSVAAGRIVIGAAVLAAVAALRGAVFPRSADVWLKLLAMGTLGTAVPFALINWGETHIDSGLAAILMSAVPLSTVVLAHLLQHDEPLTTGKIVGVALGGAGILVLVGPSAWRGARDHQLAELAVLAATLCDAGNGIIARRLKGLSPDVTSAGMLVTAALVAVPASLAIDQPWRLDPTATSLLAVAGLGLLPTAVGYILAFRIIASAGAGFASFNNYLVPLFGVFWGVLLLGEEPQPQALLGLAIVLAGLAAPRLWPGRAVVP
jgi:drug/metabolite transporter (DMT)-like permease